jgi:hypothetical protein
LLKYCLSPCQPAEVAVNGDLQRACSRLHIASHFHRITPVVWSIRISLAITIARSSQARSRLQLGCLAERDRRGKNLKSNSIFKKVFKVKNKLEWIVFESKR